MKIREIILDFTSLLDIFMLILFFFILFSHFEVEEAKETANQALNEAAALSETAESIREQAEEELALLDEVNHGKAADLTALMELSRGTLMQSRLVMDESGEIWTLELKRMDDTTKQDISLGMIDDTQNISQEIILILQKQEYTNEDKIPFVFLYDGTEIGSETACNLISEAFREIRRTYPHFYCIQIDISDFGG
ncbi:MAG: hypothetical protein IJ642_04945 [Oscillospiraceae bacterium]|nr:hypothetical protein [Oscillospiraceae bacterium]